MGEWRRIVLQACLATLAGAVLAPPSHAAPPEPAAPRPQAVAAPALPAGSTKADRRTQTEAQLQALQVRIAAIGEKVNRDAAQSDRATQELQVAEASVASARASSRTCAGSTPIARPIGPVSQRNQTS